MLVMKIISQLVYQLISCTSRYDRGLWALLHDELKRTDVEGAVSDTEIGELNISILDDQVVSVNKLRKLDALEIIQKRARSRPSDH